MSFSQGQPNDSLDFVLNNVGELNLLSHYLGISYIPCLINSPLRQDRQPSFKIYFADNNRIQYHDFGNKDSGSVIDLLSRMWNKSIPDTLDKIITDLKLNTLPVDKRKITYNYSGSQRIKSSIKLECKIRNWKDYDLKYWEQFGITKEWLTFGDVYPISHLIVHKNNGIYTITADKYAYVYVERKDNRITLKIYQPFNEKYKWSNQHDSSIWDLWTKLPKKGEDLIITKSRKDALCIWANTGIPSTGLQAEGYTPKEKVINELKNRFKNIYILYDNDYDKEINVGRLNAEKIAKEFDLTQIEIPDKFKSKDISDLYYNYDKQTVRDVIFKLINK